MTEFMVAYVLILITILLRPLINFCYWKSIQALAEAQNSFKSILDKDIDRVWSKFFESYLFVYVNSKSIPTDKEFFKFRTEYLYMFNLIVGKNRCEVYKDLLQGREQLEQYLQCEFERRFQSKFVQLIMNTIDAKE